MKYVLFLMMILFSSQAVALNCKKQPTCAELNYSKDDDPQCAEDGYVLCPFDFSYKKCLQPDCESLGFTQSDKSDWCKNIAACPNNPNYTACIKATCEIGDVYYSDGSCGLVDDYNGSKTPVGVVYYVTDGGYHGKVINLHDLGREALNKPFDPANPKKYTNLYWGYYDYDLQKLTNYDSGNTLTQLQNRNPDLYDGQGNTDKILADSGPTSCSYENIKQYYQHCMPQAAQATHDFYPLGVKQDDPKVGAGQWYLPALGELMELYGYDNSEINDYGGTSGAKGNNIKLVNNTLEALKNKEIVAEKFTAKGCYWSASEFGNKNSWVLCTDDGQRYNGDKAYGNYVRASLQF